jgi:hypothetical protein
MMLELMARVFERLNQFGAGNVRSHLGRGEYLGDPDLVREWLALQRPGRTQTPVASNIKARQRR